MRALALWLLLLAPSFGAETRLPGLDLTLTPPRLEALRQILVEPKGLSPQAFQAYVALEPDAMVDVLAAQKARPDAIPADAFGAVYGSLRRVARRDELPFEERAALTMILARQSAAYLGVMAADSQFPEPTRAVARRMRERLEDGSAVAGILYADHVERQADRLLELARPVRRAVRGERAEPEGAEKPWRIPAPPAERTCEPGKVRVHVESLRELHQSLRERGEELEQRLARIELLEGERFSDRAKAKELEAFAAYIEKLWSGLEQDRRQAQRVGEVSIRKTLLQGKPHRISRVPANKGLLLIPKRGGFLIKARFKSSIADRRVWQAVKESIEREWQGRFRYAGRSYFLRTQVSIEPLGEGEEPGDDFLVLKEGHEAASHAGGEGITLTRDFAYATPAHEFGHVLGLPDEYREVYDFDAMVARHSSPTSTLMANTHVDPGVLWPRHFKLAYQLLRRHRLAAPRSPQGRSK